MAKASSTTSPVDDQPKPRRRTRKTAPASVAAPGATSDSSAKPTSTPKPQPATRSESQSDAKSDARPDTKQDARSASKPDPAPASRPEAKAEARPDQRADSRQDSRQDARSSSGDGGHRSSGGGHHQSQHGQSQQGQGKRRKKKRNKGGSAQQQMRRPGSAPGIPAGALPSDDELRHEAEELARTLETKEGKEAKKNALHLDHLQSLPLKELHDLAKEQGMEDFHQTPRQELIFQIMKTWAEQGGLIYGAGTLEILKEGYGFLRSPLYSYLPGPDDIYVSPSQIRRNGLGRGMIIEGPLRSPKESDNYFALLGIDTVNDRDPELVHSLNAFEDLTPLHPHERFILETEPDRIETRVVDLVAPIGKGQRALIVAPPRTGKTVLLQLLTKAISQNYPDTKIIVLLIDERPEEVTDFRRNTEPSVEVVASTFDEQTHRHVQVAEMVIEKARRMVEFGDDVVILLDSITRLARAYNAEMPHSGKIMTGGIDSGALTRPKKFFGSARAIEDGGSLTILGTALVDTGSKADEVIFEEFKGTGNSELHLDRRLVEKRIYPAIDIAASGTRREELLMDPKELELVYRLRKVLSDMNVVEAMELMKSRLKKTKSNGEFLMTMNLG